MSKKHKKAVYIGRFQPVHNAHLKTVEKALEMADELIIFIGSDKRPRTIKNPFSTGERILLLKNAIREYFEEKARGWSDTPEPSVLDRIQFIGCRDYLYNNYNWASEIFSKALVNGATDNKETVLIGCMKDDSSYYLKMFPQWDWYRMPYIDRLDATDIRNEVLETGKVGKFKPQLQPFVVKMLEQRLPDFKDAYEYYKKYKEDHKYRNVDAYKPAHVTVDSVVIRSGCVLLIKRKFHPGIDQYALPGGFLKEDLTLKESALEELKEETRIRVPKKKLRDSIKDQKIFDHPKRSLRGRVITTAYLIDLGYGALPQVNGASDASNAEWMPMADVLKMEEDLFEDHRDIIIQMTSLYDY